MIKQACITLYRKTKRSLTLLSRMLARIDQRILANYKPKDNKWKLHIGCGSHILNDYINADLYPASWSVLRLDAARRLPLRDDSFDYIFSEHMIEHIPYRDGLAMLSECHRILRKGGKIRLSTPDISFLAKLCLETNSLSQAYVNWATKTFIKDAQPDDPTFVVNNFFRDWGHQFIYSESTLRRALEISGFTDITKCHINKSQTGEFLLLENNKRMPDGFLEFESMTLEATKN